MPAPDGPTSATIWPGSTVKSTPLRTGAFSVRSRVTTSSRVASETSVGARVAEVHVAELEPARAGRDGDGVRLLLDAGPQVEDLEDPVERDQRAHHVDPDVAQRGERAVEPGEQQGEGDHGAGGDAAGDREPAAQAVGQRLRERGDQQHGDEEGAGVHRLLHADVADPLGALAEPGRLRVRPPEQLDQQRAGDVEPLGHRRVHLRVQVVRLAGDLGQLLADPAGRDDEQRQHDQRQQR